MPIQNAFTAGDFIRKIRRQLKKSPTIQRRFKQANTQSGRKTFVPKVIKITCGFGVITLNSL